MSRMKYTIRSFHQNEDGSEQELAKKTYFGFKQFVPSKGLTKSTNLLAVVSWEDTSEVWEIDDEESFKDLMAYYKEQGGHVFGFIIAQPLPAFTVQ